MKIQTFTIVEKVNWRNFKLAVDLASRCDATTALITGKGEPTLHTEQLEAYVHKLEGSFPLIELQTNGLQGARGKVDWLRLRNWGLTTVAISVVHYEQDRNAEIYGGLHYDLAELIDELHDVGLSVRLTVMMMHDYIDSIDEVRKLIGFARENRVEQVTLRNISTPINPQHGDEVARWIFENQVSFETMRGLKQWLHINHTLVLRLAYGAEVFDVAGQNVCLSNCLTVNEERDTLRQLIFFPDGHLRYAWQYPGAILL
jgi:hypothetical protein